MVENLIGEENGSKNVPQQMWGGGYPSDTPEDQTLSSRYVTFEALWTILQRRKFVSDPDYERMVYRHLNETHDIAIIDDCDLQNAIDHYCTRGIPVLRIIVVTPDAIGWLAGHLVSRNMWS